MGAEAPTEPPRMKTGTRREHAPRMTDTYPTQLVHQAKISLPKNKFLTRIRFTKQEACVAWHGEASGRRREGDEYV
jgi:hypothetical protein